MFMLCLEPLSSVRDLSRSKTTPIVDASRVRRLALTHQSYPSINPSPFLNHPHLTYLFSQDLQEICCHSVWLGGILSRCMRPLCSRRRPTTTTKTSISISTYPMHCSAYKILKLALLLFLTTIIAAFSQGFNWNIN